MARDFALIKSKSSKELEKNTSAEEGKQTNTRQEMRSHGRFFLSRPTEDEVLTKNV